MYGNRVVVTGLGAITPIGLSVDEYWTNLLGGVSGAARITTFDPEGLPVQIAAEVKDFDPGNYMDRKAARRMERFSQFSIAAAGQALEDAGLKVDESNAWDIGAIIATGGGGIGAVAAETETLVTRGWERVGPLKVPLTIANMASCQASRRAHLLRNGRLRQWQRCVPHGSAQRAGGWGGQSDAPGVARRVADGRVVA